MKLSIPFKFLCAALCAGGLGPGAQRTAAAVVYNPGDLLLGFHATAGTGANASYVFNLGPAHEYRTNPTQLVTSNNLSVDLSATFGAGWFGRTDLFWGIAAVRDPAGSGPNTVVNGDPRAAIYISKETISPATSLAWDLPADGGDPTKSSPTISVANSISGMQIAFTGRTETATSGGRGTVQLEDATINSWDEYNPIPNGAAFGGILTGGVQASLGGGTLEYLDLYRVLGRTSASATPDSGAGDGVYVTTFSINAAGLVTAVPEPTSALLLGLGVAVSALRRRRNA